MVNAGKIVKFHKDNNLTQAQLAERIGISVSHLSHIENGRASMSIETLQAAAQVFGVSTEELLEKMSVVEVPPLPKLSQDEPGILFEYGEGKTRTRCVLPVTPESYKLLENHMYQSKIDMDPKLREVVDMWTGFDEEAQEKLYSAIKDIVQKMQDASNKPKPH